MDTNWTEMAAFLRRHRGALIVAPPLDFFSELHCVPYSTFLKRGKFDFFVIHKPIFNWIDHDIMEDIFKQSRLVWENSIFYVLRKQGFWRKKGLDTTKMENRLNRSMQEPVYDRKIVFVHIPKCAGRTLYQGLRKYYHREIYLRNFSSDVNLQQNNFIAGHLNVCQYEQLLRGTHCLWLTVLREPKKRIASFIAHARRDNKPSLLIGERMAVFRNNSIKELTDSDHWFRLSTESISMLSGLPASGLTIKTLNEYFECALEFIQRENVLIGIQEDMPRYYEMLKAATGLSPDVTRKKNVSSNYSSISEDEMALLDAYRPSYLLKEMELYNIAKDLFYKRYDTLGRFQMISGNGDSAF